MSNILHRQAHTNTKLKVAEVINNRYGATALVAWAGDVICVAGALNPDVPGSWRIGLGLGSVMLTGFAVQETTIARSPVQPELVTKTTANVAEIPSQRQAPAVEQAPFVSAPVVAEI